MKQLPPACRHRPQRELDHAAPERAHQRARLQPSRAMRVGMQAMRWPCGSWRRAPVLRRVMAAGMPMLQLAAGDEHKGIDIGLFGGGSRLTGTSSGLPEGVGN